MINITLVEHLKGKNYRPKVTMMMCWMLNEHLNIVL